MSLNLTDFKAKVSLELSNEPQRQAKAVHGVDAIMAGIAELASMGYRVALVEEFGTHEAPVPMEYPKMLTRQGEYPTEITVEDEVAESEARKQGYSFKGDIAPIPQPAVGSQPVNPEPSATTPKPAMTDKQVLDARMAAGSGTSTPNVSTGDAAAKVAP